MLPGKETGFARATDNEPMAESTADAYEQMDLLPTPVILLFLLALLWWPHAELPPSEPPPTKGDDCCVCLAPVTSSAAEIYARLPPRAAAITAEFAREAVCCLPCGHVLHVECLQNWTQHGDDCPLCRGPLVATSSSRSFETLPSPPEESQ